VPPYVSGAEKLQRTQHGLSLLAGTAQNGAVESFAVSYEHSPYQDGTKAVPEEIIRYAGVFPDGDHVELLYVGEH
jgi:hypothetical protein